MSSGTTTMKMISSTSTTSTSGVMLISDCRLFSESRVLNPITSVHSCASALRDQPDSAEPGLFDCDHGLTHLAEVEPCIAPDHNPGLLLIAYRGAERVAELLRRDHLIVDPQFPGVVDGDQDPASLVTLVGR